MKTAAVSPSIDHGRSSEYRAVFQYMGKHILMLHKNSLAVAIVIEKSKHD